MLDFIFIRAIFVLVFSCTAAYFRPEGMPAWPVASIGATIGLLVVALERRFGRTSLQRIMGMATGAIAGLVGAALISVVLTHLGQDAPVLRFAQAICLLVLVYFGAMTGAEKGEMLDLTAFGGVFGGVSDSRRHHKILDTSVIIDGRIADLADTGFIDGVLVIPQFVLQELQSVADSSDPMRRNRGRRGLDILQRIQKMPHVNVQIVQEDFPQVREVDMKLIELARLFSCKIVTNDFNLNKVAHLRGVEVLNINDLANSMRPVVLPGELMRVFILKEGKEQAQGVAYLDDGTMVVVDNARRMISKTIDITVTSVLQTTAGKMIFGKFDERTQAAAATAAGTERRDALPQRQQATGEV